MSGLAVNLDVLLAHFSHFLLMVPVINNGMTEFLFFCILYAYNQNIEFIPKESGVLHEEFLVCFRKSFCNN